MNKQLTSLMQKEMTRKEFLTTFGFGLATLAGFGSIIRLLTGKNHSSRQVSSGYGSSVYGGHR
ncbi:MAG TPA: hypothetical protein VMR45_02835 [Patescibacteria group bacterium]|nr:hypothetical protein [Patescibacteria group bacterium]